MKKVAYIATVPVVLLLVWAVIHLVVGQSQKRTVDQEQSSLAQARLSNNAIMERDDNIGRIIFHAVAREADACDRLHLPKAERARRIEAVHQAGMAEWRRVAASHYTIPFQVPPTD